MSLFHRADEGSAYYEHMKRRVSQVTGARSAIDKMWRKYEQHADSNFAVEFALHPRERFWEMLLTVSLLEAGFDLSCPKPGPDIRLQTDAGPIWIEAVAPTPGSGPDEVPEPPENATFDYPEDQIILRFRSAIEAKHRRRTDYINRGTIAASDPYVVAVSGGQMPVLIDMSGSPAILKAVYPLGAPQIRVELATGRAEDGGFALRPHISKAGGAPVSTTCFVGEEHSGISAILFSEANFLMTPEQAREEFLVIHNACASSPLTERWLGFGREFFPLDDGEGISGQIVQL